MAVSGLSEKPPKPMDQSPSNGFPVSPSHLPSQKDWDKALDLPIQDGEGKTHTFGSLVQPDQETDTVAVLFVRHFFCGLCQNYIESLSPLITPETLKAHRTRLIIIGCGASSMIKEYAHEVKTRFPIYTDHSRAIYKAFSLGRTLQGPSKKPAYVKTTVMEMGFKALKTAVKGAMHGSAFWQAGDMSQVGGEWFIRNGRVEWGHRMPDTAGHMSVEEVWDVVKYRADQDGEPGVKSGIVRASTVERTGGFRPPAGQTIACRCG